MTIKDHIAETLLKINHVVVLQRLYLK